ncbi:OmpH family outer membrane protein [Halarsenatibacter silvermanii]|uniref:Outer membrane protein (OmpH-like) n=1 Tax=Halarsenatibacter silvermanii TaxID=321763 RepID=A0A1G9P7Z8_9FIRM|nr:OmpH family outer membrane protein [Halarsenatibacter silvermanii]SDL94879.1 Outer membrane protein (OmpH-like) [Halarsenatibacter silvermanii]
MKYWLKLGIVVFIFLLTLAFVSQPAAAVVDVNVGTVNLQEVIDAHPEAEELEEEMQGELAQLEQEFQSQVQSMEEEDPQAIQQMQQQMQQQAEIIQQQKMEEMMNIIQPEMDEFRQEEELDLILMNESVLSGGEDITEELIDFIQ